MPVNELIVAVVFQEMDAMLEDNRGNQAIHVKAEGSVLEK